MNTKNQLKYTIVTGIIVGVLTLIVFFSNISDSTSSLDYAALLFVLISDIVLFTGVGKLLSIENTNKLMIRSGVITILVIYWMLSTLVSIFSRSIFNYIGGLTSTQVILLGITALITIFIKMGADKAHVADVQMQNTKFLMQEGSNVVFDLKNNPSFAEYSESLEKLYEALKFSDNLTKDITKDEEILIKLGELKNDLNSSIFKNEEITEKIGAIISLIKQRNNLVIQSKRGGF